MKKLVCLVLSLLLLLSCMSFAQAENIEKIVIFVPAFGDIPTGSAKVEEAINAITREKIGVEVEIHWTNTAVASQELSLMMASDEQVDIIIPADTQQQTQGMYMSLIPYMDLLSDMTGCLSDGLKQLMYVGGEPYFFVANAGYPQSSALWCLKDICDAIGVGGQDLINIKKFSDLEAILNKVHDQYPEMEALAVNTGGFFTVDLLTLCDSYQMFDNLGDMLGAVILDPNSPTVENLFASKIFEEYCYVMKSFQEKGLMSKDLAVQAEFPSQRMNAGKMFARGTTYNTLSLEEPLLTATATNLPVYSVPLAVPVLQTNSYKSARSALSATSKHPEAACKFVNLLYTDADVLNLLNYGIEGENYVLKNGCVAVPEGYDDFLSTGYVPFAGFPGNTLLIHAPQGDNPDYYKQCLEATKDAVVSPAFGLSFDMSEVADEQTAILNVIPQYLPTLCAGVGDPAILIPEFVEKLEAAGMGRIIEVKQAQLNAFLGIE